MIFYNGSSQEICVGSTLKGAPAHQSMMMKPGETLVVPETLVRVRIEFASTPDGLRMAIYEEGIILPSQIHLN